MLRSLSLCSGVGGLDQAVDLVTPTELVAYADPDPDASRVMSHNYPGVPNLGDITVYDFSLLRNEGIDLLTAGYPCQPFSLNGQRRGTSDQRHLYPFISTAVRTLRPGIVFLENVPGHRSKGFGEVLWDLSSCGYRVAWVSVRASDSGAPHRRERVFILAAYSEVLRRWALSDFPRGSTEELSVSAGDGLPAFEWGRFSPALTHWELCRGVAPYPVGRGPRGGFALTAEFGEWIMGLPAGWISAVPGVSLRAAAKLYGNGVVPQQGARAFAHLVSVLDLA